MSFKKKLYYFDNNDQTIKCEEKIISIKLNTGFSEFYESDNEIFEKIITNKFIKNKIYPPDVIVDSENKIYFENIKLCELLGQNSFLQEIKTSKLLLKKINNLLSNIEENLDFIESRLPSINKLELNIINIMKKYRKSHHEDWTVIYETLTNLRECINEFGYSDYHDFIYLNNKLVSLKKFFIIGDLNFLFFVNDSYKLNEFYNNISLPKKFISYLNNEIKDVDNFNNKSFMKTFDFVNDEFNQLIEKYNISA